MPTLEESFKAQTAAYELQRAKFEALRDALGNYGNFRYVNFYDFLDPDNQNWQDYTYSQHFLTGSKHGRVSAGTPVGEFIQRIRDAKNIDNVGEQLKIWNSSKPLDSYDNGISYIRHFIPRFAMHSTTPSVDSRPVQATAGDAQGAQGAQGVVTVGGAQGAQAGVQAGNAGGAQAGAGVVKGGTQGSNNGSGGTQGTQGVQAGGTTGKPRMSDDEIDAFLKEELGGDTTGNGTYASSGVSKGGTKTIGYDPYDPNPGNVSLAYAMRNAPEQERRAALIDEWNREHGISYVTGKDGVIYRTDPQHPNGYVDPFKNDLSTWTRATRSGSTYASPGISTGGTYATGEGIKDANGNVLTNPGGNWEYQYALRDPAYGLGMRDRMSDAQRNYWQAVAHDMGYNYDK